MTGSREVRAQEKEIKLVILLRIEKEIKTIEG